MTIDRTPHGARPAFEREHARDADYRVRIRIEAMVREGRTEKEIVAAVRAMTAEHRRAA